MSIPTLRHTSAGWRIRLVLDEGAAPVYLDEVAAQEVARHLAELWERAPVGPARRELALWSRFFERLASAVQKRNGGRA